MGFETKLPAVPPAALVSTRLCLACGLCCDGTLFKDVALQPGDEAAKHARCSRVPASPASAASIQPTRAKLSVSRWPQPCACLGTDVRCLIYTDRPSRCRDFECHLLQQVLAGAREIAEALRLIQRTRKAADQVRRLLRELGDQDEWLPLSRRFRRMRRQCEAGGLAAMDEGAVECYAELTLCVHQVQLLLQREFYPGN